MSKAKEILSNISEAGKKDLHKEVEKLLEDLEKLDVDGVLKAKLDYAGLLDNSKANSKVKKLFMKVGEGIVAAYNGLDELSYELEKTFR